MSERLADAVRDRAIPDPGNSILALCARPELPASLRPELVRRASLVTNWDALVPLAEQHGLGPLLWKHLSHARQHVPKQTARQLYAVYARHRHRNRILLDELAGIVDALTHAEIAALVLKGPALVPLLYEDPGLRPISDLDLLVREQDSLRAQQLLRERGYDVRLPESEYGRTRHHHLEPGCKTVQGIDVQVEIHRRLLSADRDLPFALDRDLRGTCRFDVSGVRAATLDTHDMLWHLCRHLVGLWHPIRLVWVADVIGWIERYADQLDWDFIARRRRFVLSTLSLLHWVTPLPSRVLDLDVVPVTRAPGSVAIDYHGWPRATAAHWDGWDGRWQFLKSTLCPPSWWLRLNYGTGDGRPGRAVGLLRHSRALVDSVARRALDFVPRREQPPLSVRDFAPRRERPPLSAQDAAS